MVSAYRDKDLYETSLITQIIDLTYKGRLTRQRALELPVKAQRVFLHARSSIAFNHPEIYLSTDADTDFFFRMTKKYEGKSRILSKVTELIAERKLGRGLAFTFPDHASGLMNDPMAGMRGFVLSNADILLKNNSDLKLMNTLVGEFGAKADVIVKGYLECLKAGVLTTSERGLILEFARQFKVISPRILAAYKEAKAGGYESVFIARLTALAEKMTGIGTITDEERVMPFYTDLLRHVYVNNANNYGSYESNASCDDRGGDISQYIIKLK